MLCRQEMESQHRRDTARQPSGLEHSRQDALLRIWHVGSRPDRSKLPQPPGELRHAAQGGLLDLQARQTHVSSLRNRIGLLVRNEHAQTKTNLTRSISGENASD